MACYVTSSIEIIIDRPVIDLVREIDGTHFYHKGAMANRVKCLRVIDMYNCKVFVAWWRSVAEGR